MTSSSPLHAANVFSTLAPPRDAPFLLRAQFKTKVQSETFKPGCEREDVKFLMSIAMHTGDIANPAKPLKCCLQWTELVMEEFFRQGDLEQQLGMPISPFYDRSKNQTSQCQIGFINVLVRPLYAELCGLLGEPALTEAFGALELNLKAWETAGNDLFKEFAAGNVTVAKLQAGTQRGSVTSST